MEHLRKTLSHCKYPQWALGRVDKKLTKPTIVVSYGADSQDTTGAQLTSSEAKTKGHIVIPYTQCLCKSTKKICSRYGVQTHFKGNSTIKNLLVSLKDKDPMANKSGALYWFQCGDFTCNDEYIGKTSKTFGERFKEHLKEPFHIHHHSINTGHPTTQHNFQIIGRGATALLELLKNPFKVGLMGGGVSLGILSMPNSLCMPFYFRTRSIKENPIPYMV